MPGIDPGTSRMLSARSTIWATPPHESKEIILFMYFEAVLLRHNSCASDNCERFMFVIVEILKFISTLTHCYYLVTIVWPNNIFS